MLLQYYPPLILPNRGMLTCCDERQHGEKPGGNVFAKDLCFIFNCHSNNYTLYSVINYYI